MKTNEKMLIVALLQCLAAALMLLTGCASVKNNPTQLAAFLADARDIASLGTTAVLIEKPGYRPVLEQTRDALHTIEVMPEGKVTVDDLVLALSKLPLDQFQSDRGRIYSTGGRILVRRFVNWASDPEMDVGSSGALQKFAGAIREGMDEGLRQ